MGQRAYNEHVTEMELLDPHNEFGALDFDSDEYDAVHAADFQHSVEAQERELAENSARQLEIDAEIFELQTIGWVD